MVVEKMKLKILEKLSHDLKNHVDSVFDKLSELKTDYCIERVAKHYAESKGKDIDYIRSTGTSWDLATCKRDITFIYYCLVCPFFREFGIDSTFPKEQRKNLEEYLSITRGGHLKAYIPSAKHYYRIYESYRKMINEQIRFHLDN